LTDGKFGVYFDKDFPNDKKLIMQINSLRYQVSRTGNLFFESSEKEGVHDDYLWALALACYAARENPLIIKGLFGDDWID